MGSCPRIRVMYHLTRKTEFLFLQPQRPGKDLYQSQETRCPSNLDVCGVSMFVYYESRKREQRSRPIYECRYDERLKTNSEKSTRLGYTGLLGGLEHLKIETPQRQFIIMNQ
jgi:hypothetical protein